MTIRDVCALLWLFIAPVVIVGLPLLAEKLGIVDLLMDTDIPDFAIVISMFWMSTIIWLAGLFCIMSLVAR